MGADLAVFYFLLWRNASLVVSHVCGFMAAAVVLYAFEAVRQRRNASFRPRVRETLSFLFIALSALFFSGGVLALLTDVFGLVPAVAAPGTAAAAVLVMLGGIVLFVSCQSGAGEDQVLEETRLIAIIVYAVLLRLVYMGSVELLHEEGYYWNYGQHLALAYFDHPPMVGWLIRGFSSILGDGEIAVRAGPFVGWIVAAYYTYRLAGTVLDKSVARCAVMLMAVLPVYFSLGLVMIPDAPLIACWAGAVYYLHRALIRERRGAWIGVGIFMGLAMLSKYTAVLLGPAGLLFILFDQRARKWLLRPEPYLAAVIALLIFSPVILWNGSHEWASFKFQGVGRLTGRFDFDLPDMIGSILLLLTPTGLLTAGAVLWAKKALTTKCGTGPADETNRSYRLLVTLTLVPLAVFFGFSLFRNIKLHWTAPIWLSVIPYMAAFISRRSDALTAILPAFPGKLWPATIGTVLLLYGAGLHYLTLGFPGVPYFRESLGVGMQDLAVQVERIIGKNERITGETPLVVCMDKDRLAGWISFYRVKGIKQGAPGRLKEKALRVSGGHFFGKNSKMYRYWFPPEAEEGRSLLLIGRKRDDLSGSRVKDRSLRLGEIGELPFRKNGKPAGRFYYRFLYGYRP